MLDVSNNQFLVLLLVVQAQFDKPKHAWVVAFGQKALHGEVDVFAVARDFSLCGPRHHSARGSFRPLTYVVVVGVEEEPKAIIKSTIPRQVRRQNECLEEPGGVGPVPLYRAGLKARL